MATVTRPTGSPEPLTIDEARRLGPIRSFFLRKPRAMDAVVMAFFALAAGMTVAFPYDHDRLWSALAFIAVGTLALAWRRSQPVAVAVVIGAVAALCTATTGQLHGFELGVGLAVYSVAVDRSSRTSWTTAVALVVTTSAAVWLWEQPVADVTAATAADGAPVIDDRLGSVVGTVVITLAALAIGTSVRNRRLYIGEIVERTNALARDRERQAEIARVSERNRIAREMHDVVAHSLSVMVALADGASAAMDRAPEASRAALGELSATGRTALADMRRVLGVLGEGTAPLEPQPGAPGLQELVERFRTAGLPVHAEGLTTSLPTDTGFQLTVYRVVQEALTNTLRHAPGTPHAELTIRSDADSVIIEVIDHGARVPATRAAGSGHGLVGMAERAQVYGGSVTSGPWADGWRVRVVLPWPGADT